MGGGGGGGGRFRVLGLGFWVEGGLYGDHGNYSIIIGYISGLYGAKGYIVNYNIVGQKGI